MQTSDLSHKDSHTLAQIFQHPVSHNLEWHDVINLIAHLGTVEENDNGHLTFMVNDMSLVFHRSQDKDISEIQQVLDLRHFLESARVIRKGAATAAESEDGTNLRLLVVINQQETLVFRSEGKGSVPERLHPHDPHGVLLHRNHTRGGDIGSRTPENVTYYQDIARTLAGAEEVLLMGNGSGASSAMAHLQDFLTTHHQEIAKRIVGNLTLDLEALTEGQILQEARAFFMHRDGLGTDRTQTAVVHAA